MNNQPLRVIQITDSHLFADNQRKLLGVNTYDSFAALVDLVKQDPKPADLILLTGDLSQDETEGAYLIIADVMKDFKAPVHCIPGNHDNAKIMYNIFPRNNVLTKKHIVLDKWQFILLDTHKENAVEGYLNPLEMMFLKNCLEMYPEQHAIVVLHHHSVPINCAWLDKIGLTNANEFWEVLSKYSQVKAVIFGHIHQHVEGVKNGIHYFSTPSTCFQFKKNSDPFALEKLPPGYRWIDLYPDGEFKTEVRRLDKYIGDFNEDAKGY